MANQICDCKKVTCSICNRPSYESLPGIETISEDDPGLIGHKECWQAHLKEVELEKEDQQKRKNKWWYILHKKIRNILQDEKARRQDKKLLSSAKK